MKEGGGELLIVHCEEYAPPGPRLPSHTAAYDEDEVRAAIEERAREAGAPLKIVKTHFSGGAAAHAIADVAEDEHADLIAVGSRGHSGIAGLLLGSVTQRLLQVVQCPVLVVPQSRR